MQKLLLTALLCFCVNAYAFNWVKTSSASGSDLYADTSSIKKVGNLIYVWQLMDFLEPQQLTNNGNTYSSVVTKHKVGCDEVKSMRLVYEIYSSNMGRGILLDSFSSEQIDGEPWMYYKPGSVAESFVKFVCNLAK